MGKQLAAELLLGDGLLRVGVREEFFCIEEVLLHGDVRVGGEILVLEFLLLEIHELGLSTTLVIIVNPIIDLEWDSFLFDGSSSIIRSSLFY